MADFSSITPPWMTPEQLSPAYVEQETAGWMREKTLEQMRADAAARARDEARIAAERQERELMDATIANLQRAAAVDDQMKNIQQVRRFIGMRGLERDLQSGVPLPQAAARNLSAFSTSTGGMSVGGMRLLTPQVSFPAPGTTMDVPGGSLIWRGGTATGQFVKAPEATDPSLLAGRTMDMLTAGRQAAQSEKNAADQAVSEARVLPKKERETVMPNLQARAKNADAELQKFNEMVRVASTNKTTVATPTGGTAVEAPLQPGADPIAEAFKKWQASRANRQ